MNGVKTKLDDANRELVKDSSGYHPPLLRSAMRPTAYSATAMKTVQIWTERKHMDILKEYPLIDEHGKRYREFGRRCREYAPVIVTSAGEVPI